jgi:long-chain acyl-CoA synthetase
MFDFKTVNDVFTLLSGRGDAVVMQTQDASGVWQPITARQLYGRVRALAEVFLGWGIVKGDRIAILSENRWEWAVTDLAALTIGAVDVPLYPTLTPEQIGYMLRDSGAKVAVVSSAEQYENLKAAGEVPDLQYVVVMDQGEWASRDGALPDGPVTESFTKLMEFACTKEQRDPVFDALVAEAKPQDLVTIIYTSGTTGEPKGVMLTHGNLATNINFSMSPYPNRPGDTYVSFLPLSHIFARHVDYALMAEATEIAYCPRFDQLTAAMRSIRPAIFIAVPRVYEKIRQGVEAKSAGSPVKSRILRWALGVGKANRDAVLAGVRPSGLAYRLADKLVYGKLREAFGGRARIFISGGAALGMDTAAWFADMGIRIFEGYGLTETSPVITMNAPSAHRMGTVGKKLPNVECRFAEDGELEVKGPSVFPGYWKKEKETSESFTPDGWFKTGDIGTMDADGFISITDRKKELLKTSGGKLIAPQPIENKLKANSLVGHAALVGDKHKFVCVLISPNMAALEKWAAGQGITSTDHKTLVKDSQVVSLYQGIVTQVNGTLAHFEDIKRMCVVPDEWTVEGGELTPSMKLKRRVVEKKYAPEIADFYKDEATAAR